MKRFVPTMIALAVASVPLTSSANAPLLPLLKGHLQRLEGERSLAVKSYEEALRGDKSSIRLRIELARALTQGRDRDRALEVLDEGLRLYPESSELWFAKARILGMLNRLTEGGEAALKAARAGGGSRAYTLAVRLRAQSEDVAGAEETVREWLTVEPDNIRALGVLAEILSGKGQTKEASDVWGELLELDSGNFAALSAMGEQNMAAGELEKAVELWEAALKRNPKGLKIRLKLIEALLELDRADRAGHHLGLAQPESIRSPEARFRVGMLMLRAKLHAQAEKLLEEFTPENSVYEGASYLIGLARMFQEKYEGAIEAFAKVGKDSNFSSDAVIQTGEALRKLSRPDEALMLMRDWLDRHPEDGEVAIGLAQHWEDMGDIPKAIETLEAFIAGNHAKAGRLEFALGVLHDKNGEWEKSTEYMAKVVAANPKDAQALNYLGYTWADKGVKLGEAEKLIARALEIRPNDGYIIDSLAWTYYRQGRLQEAKTTIERALELKPEDQVIWGHYGDILLDLGLKEEARSAYSKSLGIKPDEEIRKKLEGIE